MSKRKIYRARLQKAYVKSKNFRHLEAIWYLRKINMINEKYLRFAESSPREKSAFLCRT